MFSSVARQFQKMPGHVDDGDGHAVDGERAGFVGADDGDGTECFDGGQLADEGAAAQHALGAEGQRDGDHGR